MLKVSFEFFPAKNFFGCLRLLDTLKKLSVFQNQFVSVTCGVDCHMSQLDTLINAQRFNKTVIPHVLCDSMSLKSPHILPEFLKVNIFHLLVLRGDGNLLKRLNGGVSWFIKESRVNFGNSFVFSGASYPENHIKVLQESKSLKTLAVKIKYGVASIITQYFCHVEPYFEMLNSLSALNLKVPVIPGVMVMKSLVQLVRFSELCGAGIPLWFLKRLEEVNNNHKQINESTIKTTTNLCEDLLRTLAPCLHLYTLNDYITTSCVLKNFTSSDDWESFSVS
jgi:methylenetetrahydrofolate reductase (NADPH)